MKLTKTTDSKGRLTLGRRFANKTVIIQEIDATEIHVTIARVIPEREAWLYENQVAKGLIMAGLQQAAVDQFSDSPPDLAADTALADELE